MPLNLDRAANHAMYAVYELAMKASDAARSAKPTQQNYSQLQLEAAKAVEEALDTIARVDVEPDAEFAAFIEAKRARRGVA